MRKLFFRYNLIWVVFLMLLLPGLFGILAIFFGEHAVPTVLRPGYRLIGVTQDTPPIPFDFAHFKSHDVQKFSENWLANHLPLRSFFIRMNNQIYYSLFKKSYSENGKLIIGKSQQLLVDNYIVAYCGPGRTSTQLAQWAKKLKLLSDFFQQQGKTFIYVMTPSKAEYYPQAIPDRYRCHKVGVSTYVKNLARLLDMNKIAYVNGSDLMLTASKQYGVAMFPQGGIHWNKLGASVAANAIIDRINHAGDIHLNPLRFNYVMTKKPNGSDSDLLSLLNVMHPNSRYDVPKIKFDHVPSSSKPIMTAMIGSSFSTLLMDIFLESKTFQKISFYRYFKLDRTDYEENKIPTIHPVDVNLADAMTSILSNDVIILEENAEVTVSGHGQLLFDAMKNYLARTRSSSSTSPAA